ncbi:RIP metalloprotease RseP [Thiomicrorhabdus aquaedulcis]|uniref:RIP metalloprotease RseP n=1 Tax=Thiomicrorhabdus aquaedulcis TaxID=2211106 RepID=UPI000FD98274|nr:RIP metalloprotease RseP [Thiomicrorhabdus aquaedulcis]
MSVLWSVLGFIVVIALLVGIHEWGHYQVARWFNIKVLEFSIGFGKPLYQRQGKETRFSIAMIPLGGFVKFVDEREGNVAPEDLARAFNRQSVYKRFAVVAAGPIINLVFAWLVLSAMFMIGVSGVKPIINQTHENSPLAISAKASQITLFENDQAWSITRINNESVASWQMVHQAVLHALIEKQSSVDITLQNALTQRELTLFSVGLDGLDINQTKQNWLKELGLSAAKISVPPVVGQVLPNSAGQLAGLQTDDLIVSIDGQQVAYWHELVERIQANPNQLVDLTFMRNANVVTTQVRLESNTLADGQVVGKLGVGVKITEADMAPYTSVVRYGYIESLGQGFDRSVDLLQMSWTMLKRMLLGEVSVQNLSGPLSIAEFSGQAMQTGFISFLGLLALLSLSLGFLNLLPIPVLDGGHLMFYLVEMLKGSPVNEKIMMVGQQIGLVLILGLTFVALFNDVVRIANG